MRTRVVAVAAAVVLLLGSIAVAQPKVQGISQIVVLGDSLSDNGNFYRATGSPPFPYWEGRISNGPVAVEYLADNLGALPLWDFAWSGATTGVGNYHDGGTVDALGAYHLPGITMAFQGALAANLFPIDPDALYVVWGGPNDFWTVSTQQEIATALQKAVTNLVTIVGQSQARR